MKGVNINKFLDRRRTYRFYM